MYTTPTNVINSTPDFLVGVEGGNPVLVPRGIALSGPTGQEDLNGAERTAVKALVSRAGIVASDEGSAWIGAPGMLSFSAVLTSGTATTVLLEVRDAAGAVATAATITADTVSQVLRQALLLRQQSEYRFRRSSGTGIVTITV